MLSLWTSNAITQLYYKAMVSQLYSVCAIVWVQIARCRHALTAEMSETFPSGGSMHASVKLEGIDGRAPQERVEHVA